VSPADTGDSLRRQTERAQDYCHRRGWALDDTLTLRDLGVSAFRGMNAAVGNFRVFLDAIKSGRVAPGSVLIVESFDRISRQGIDEGYDLIKGILKAGILIVTLSPEREFDASATKSLSKGALEIQLILERAAEESERKSDRIGRAWAAKQESAGTKAVTRMLPRWISARGGEGKKMKDTRPGEVKFFLDGHKAAVVRRIFKLAVDGNGALTIAKRLNTEKVPVLGRATVKRRAVMWSSATVKAILTSRAVIGEYVPYKAWRGKPAGEAVPGYFPAVIDEATFYAAQQALKTRAIVGRGRRGKYVNLFAGLLRDWRDGGTMTYRHQADGSTIVPASAIQGVRVKWVSFPCSTLETAILSQLAELTVKDVAGTDDADGRVKEAEGRLAKCDTLLRAWEAKMDDPLIVDTVAAKLAELKSERKQIIEERETAKRAVASPVANALDEIRTLADLLAADTSDETRIRVRAALRRVISNITLLILPRGRDRLAFARVTLATGGVRVYLLMSSPPKANASGRTPGRWWAHAHVARDFRLWGKILEPGFVMPESAVKRFKEMVQGTGSTTGEIP
jgi:DNA invertase Pin-like site-specific DNA recombinase